MASSNAGAMGTAGSSNGPVALQMDIDGLINTMGTLGARGLKCLAMAGVDPHTLGSMLMITESSLVLLHLSSSHTAFRLSLR